MKTNNSQLSVVLAVRNEALNLPRCLNSLKGLTNDLVIVDGQSTDQTVAIARKYTSKVFSVTHKPMFHLNKQIALEKAKHDWVLQLDADEELTPELKTEIKKAISSKQYNGYFIPRKNFFLTKFLTKGGQYPDKLIRLVRKSQAHFPCQSVHEQISVKGEVGELKNDLLHYSDPNLSRYLVRFNRYTSLEAISLSKHLKLGSAFSYLLVKPVIRFASIYIRHKGFVDGLPGFLFALFSALHFPVIYFKAIEKKWTNQ